MGFQGLCQPSFSQGILPEWVYIVCILVLGYISITSDGLIFIYKDETL